MDVSLGDILAQGIKGYSEGLDERRKREIALADEERKARSVLNLELQKTLLKEQIADELMRKRMAGFIPGASSQASSPHYVKSFNPSTGSVEIGVRTPAEMEEEKQRVAAPGLLKRFRRYGTHELMTQDPAIATQRIGQLRGKAVSLLPTQEKTIAKSFEGLKPAAEMYDTGQVDPNTGLPIYRERPVGLKKAGKGGAGVQDMEAMAKSREIADDTLRTISRVEEGLNFFGRFGDVPSRFLPNYEKRKTWEENLDKLIQRKWLESIKELKSQSRTGASGLGAMTEKEGERLEKAATALSKTSTPEMAAVYLQEMRDIIYSAMMRAEKNRTTSTNIQKTKAQRANEIYSQNPNLSRSQIIEMVNREFSK